MTPAEKLIEIVERAKNESLERATAAFKRCTPQEMNSLYGESDRTRQQIIDGYKAERAEWQAARDFLEELLHLHVWAEAQKLHLPPRRE